MCKYVLVRTAYNYRVLHTRIATEGQQTHTQRKK